VSQALIDDAIWARLEPLIPKRRVRRGHRHGRTPIPDRAILTGILFVLRSGIPWQMLPRQMGCGSGSTCWRRLVRWQRAGVWQRLHEVLLAELRRRGRLDQRWTIIDSGSVRAVRGGKTGPNPTDRRKKGSKHHLIVDARGVPLVAQVTAANVNDITQLDPLVDALPAVRSRRGRPRRRPPRRSGLRLAAASRSPVGTRDRAGARQTADAPRQRARRLPMDGRAHDRVAPSFRRLTVRYERRADVHQACLTLGCVLICWNYLKAKKRVF
jgi:transposase